MVQFYCFNKPDSKLYWKMKLYQIPGQRLYILYNMNVMVTLPTSFHGGKFWSEESNKIERKAPRSQVKCQVSQFLNSCGAELYGGTTVLLQQGETNVLFKKCKLLLGQLSLFVLLHPLLDYCVTGCYCPKHYRNKAIAKDVQTCWGNQWHLNISI